MLNTTRVVLPVQWVKRPYRGRATPCQTMLSVMLSSSDAPSSGSASEPLPMPRRWIQAMPAVLSVARSRPQNQLRSSTESHRRFTSRLHRLSTSGSSILRPRQEGACRQTCFPTAKSLPDFQSCSGPSEASRCRRNNSTSGSNRFAERERWCLALRGSRTTTCGRDPGSCDSSSRCRNRCRCGSEVEPRTSSVSPRSLQLPRSRSDG